MSFAAFLVFLLLPTAPPWYANQSACCPACTTWSTGAAERGQPVLPVAEPGRGRRLALAALGLPGAGRAGPVGISRRTAFITVPWCLAMWFSVIFLGEHYAIDVLGGIAFAVATWALMLYAVAPRIAAFRTQPATTDPTTPRRLPRPRTAT